MYRLLTFVAIRDGMKSEVLDQLIHEAEQAVEASSDLEAIVLAGEEEDPVAALIHHMRPYEAVLELRTDVSELGSRMTSQLEGLGTRLGEGIHSDLSGVVFVEENRVVPASDETLRYMALMRRKAGTTHEQYVDYYSTVHAELGRRCPGKIGYHQNYVDGPVSRRVATLCGFGMWDLDSVTELFLRSVEEFDQATSQSTIREDSAADEAHFVDGPSMNGFCARVVSRIKG